MDLRPYFDSWRIHLKALNRSERTIANYRAAVVAFTNWCEKEGRPTDPALQRPDDVRGHLAWMFDSGLADSSALTRFRCLQQWFRWLVDEEEIAVSPMAKLKPPKEVERPVPRITQAEVRTLLAACAGTGWRDRRDTAILRLLFDTGLRLGELVGMKLPDVDLPTSSALVLGKGNRERIVPFGAKTTQALDRYIRARGRTKFADSDMLWIGTRGPLSDEAVSWMLRMKGRKTGVSNVHAHRFRHAFAHEWLDGGGQEGDLMTIAGWRSRAMLGRYGKSAATERARRAHTSYGPGDKL